MLMAKEAWKAEWKASFLSRLEGLAEKAWLKHVADSAAVAGRAPTAGHETGASEQLKQLIGVGAKSSASHFT